MEMIRIANISITPRAAAALRKEKSSFQPAGKNQVFALYFIPSFVNADGTTVTGFHPGYEAGSLSLHGLKAKWALAQLPDGLEFYFMPKFEWSAREHYVVDIVTGPSTLFSIGL